MLRYLPFLLSLALTVYCLVDAIQADEAGIRNLPKLLWILLIVLFPVVGPVAWLVAGRPAGGGGSRYAPQQQRWGGDPGRRGQQRGQRPPRGPDDDPDFLKGL
ncbi:PLD nuclease N-terminal domain-containing protein [uncultured Phycicoccus sp.]|uniref:PLD nuclease N-terminal domain-containing protein n=1 Tax=uncultured Phycicoccus sp. TaxID=661422 RepID=UPI002622415A|nr:PLD nuclease N-terminal domain-containing protein [uncultured Phycicoccus sp.]